MNVLHKILRPFPCCLWFTPTTHSFFFVDLDMFILKLQHTSFQLQFEISICHNHDRFLLRESVNNFFYDKSPRINIHI